MKITITQPDVVKMLETAGFSTEAQYGWACNGDTILVTKFGADNGYGFQKLEDADKGMAVILTESDAPIDARSLKRIAVRARQESLSQILQRARQVASQGHEAMHLAVVDHSTIDSLEQLGFKCYEQTTNGEVTGYKLFWN